MKKRIFMLICFILILSFANSEEAVYETGRDLYVDWDRDGNYPDYACSIVTSEKEPGKYLVGVIDEKYIETVLGLVKDNSTLEVVVQKYSFAYLSSIGEEIQKTYGDIIAAAVVNPRYDQMTVIVRDEPSEEEKQRVENAIEMEYGDAVRIEAYINWEEQTGDVNAGNDPSYWKKRERNKTILATSVTAVTLVLIILFFRKVKKDNTEKT